MATAADFAGRKAGEVFDALCPGGEPVDGLAIDQDWGRGVTTLIFTDGSAIEFEGPSMTIVSAPKPGRISINNGRSYMTADELHESDFRVDDLGHYADREICSELENAPLTAREWTDEYLRRHEAKFGATLVIG